MESWEGNVHSTCVTHYIATSFDAKDTKSCYNHWIQSAPVCLFSFKSGKWPGDESAHLLWRRVLVRSPQNASCGNTITQPTVFIQGANHAQKVFKKFLIIRDYFIIILIILWSSSITSWLFVILHHYLCLAVDRVLCLVVETRDYLIILQSF